MDWDGDPDFWTYKTKFKTIDEWKKACGIVEWTKRSIMKTTASTFDPLGLVSPIIVFPRTIVQELWAKKLDWDDPIDEVYSQKWEEGLRNLLKVTMLAFRRWSFDAPDALLELHVFCDSSQRAFSATVYSRVNSRGRDTNKSTHG